MFIPRCLVLSSLFCLPTGVPLVSIYVCIYPMCSVVYFHLFCHAILPLVFWSLVFQHFTWSCEFCSRPHLTHIGFHCIPDLTNFCCNVYTFGSCLMPEFGAAPWHTSFCMRFEVLTMVKMLIVVCWIVILRCLVGVTIVSDGCISFIFRVNSCSHHVASYGYQNFGGMYHL
jgi:hypothetical protein